MHQFRYESVDALTEELKTWYDLRRDLYLAEGLITANELDATGAYVDRYDPYSEHVLMYDEAEPTQPIGTCRLIDGRRTRLQVHEQFGVEHGSEALEVSGFAVKPEYRKTFATVGCYWMVYRRAVDAEYDEVHFEVEIPFRNTLAAIGLPVEQTGPEKHVYNATNVPLRTVIREVVPALRAADEARQSTTRFAELFERSFDGRLDITTIFGRQDPEMSA